MCKEIESRTRSNLILLFPINYVILEGQVISPILFSLYRSFLVHAAQTKSSKHLEAAHLPHRSTLGILCCFMTKFLEELLYKKFTLFYS